MPKINPSEFFDSLPVDLQHLRSLGNFYFYETRFVIDTASEPHYERILNHHPELINHAQTWIGEEVSYFTLLLIEYGETEFDDKLLKSRCIGQRYLV